jgi:hypothetical protein
LCLAGDADMQPAARFELFLWVWEASLVSLFVFLLGECKLQPNSSCVLSVFFPPDILSFIFCIFNNMVFFLKNTRSENCAHILICRSVVDRQNLGTSWLKPALDLQLGVE